MCLMTKLVLHNPGTCVLSFWNLQWVPSYCERDCHIFGCTVGMYAALPLSSVLKTRYSKVKGMIFTLCPNYLSPKVNWGPGSDVNNAHSSNTVWAWGFHLLTHPAFVGVGPQSVVILMSSILLSLGEPVELSSRFIRYSTFRTGKEQLVS